jgi:hypothetical protein
MCECARRGSRDASMYVQVRAAAVIVPLVRLASRVKYLRA